MHTRKRWCTTLFAFDSARQMLLVYIKTGVLTYVFLSCDYNVTTHTLTCYTSNVTQLEAPTKTLDSNLNFEICYVDKKILADTMSDDSDDVDETTSNLQCAPAKVSTRYEPKTLISFMINN